MSLCVCVCKSSRKSGYGRVREGKSQDGGLCDFTHTGDSFLPVSLVSIVLVLVWYYKCKRNKKFGTRSSTTLGVEK